MYISGRLEGYQEGAVLSSMLRPNGAGGTSMLRGLRETPSHMERVRLTALIFRRFSPMDSRIRISTNTARDPVTRQSNQP